MGATYDVTRERPSAYDSALVSTTDLSPGIDLPRERPMILPWDRHASELSLRIDIRLERPVTLPQPWGRFAPGPGSTPSMRSQELQ